MLHSTRHSCVRRWVFLSCALLATGLAQAQVINVTAANASNPAIYTVDFATQTIHIENTDTMGLHSRSLVFTTNGTNDQVDLLLADNVDGTLLRYCGNFANNANPTANTSGDVVWNKTQGGPTNPDGLSVDSAGNLFLVNQGSGTSTSPQVWVIQGLETNCYRVGGANPPSAITQIDDGKTFGAKQTLEETIVAKSAIFLTGPGAAVPQLNPGDLLVLTSNPASVVLYQGSGGNGPTMAGKKNTPIVLLNSNNFPAGTQTGGMDFLPTDNSLLVTTTTGTIYKFTVDQIVPGTGVATPFVQNLGNGQFKVKTGRQAVNANQPPVIVVVANNNGGDILEFDASGQNEVIVTSGVQHPQGLAVTNFAYQQAPTCFPPSNPPNPACNVNLLGGTSNAANLLLANVLLVNLPGNILEEMCVAVTDPRVAQYGSCTEAAKHAPYLNGLSVAQLCGAGFDNPHNPLYIPNSMCGASGIKPGSQPPVQGSGLTLIRTLTSAYPQNGPFPFNGTFIESQSDFSGLPQGLSDPVCPGSQVSGWAPLDGEGASPGSNSGGVNSVTDMINGCADAPRSGACCYSLYVLGADLPADVPGGLTGYAATQYTTLLNTITAETTDGALASGNFTSQLQQCITESQGATQTAPNVLPPATPQMIYAGAAQELLNEDYSVYHVAGSTPPFKADNIYPNPSGMLRGLIETTWFTVNLRLGANGDQNTPPPPNPPALPSFTSPAPLSVDITPIIKPAPAPSTTGIKNHTYTFSPATSDFAGNTATLTYSLTGLPWATLIPASNNQVVVSGTPKKAGTFNATLTVTDGCSAMKPLTWPVTITNN